jgi:hypothetical protein
MIIFYLIAAFLFGAVVGVAICIPRINALVDRINETDLWLVEYLRKLQARDRDKEVP